MREDVEMDESLVRLYKFAVWQSVLKDETPIGNKAVFINFPREDRKMRKAEAEDVRKSMMKMYVCRIY